MSDVQWFTTHGDRVSVYESHHWVRMEMHSMGHEERVITWRYRIQARNGQIVEAGSEGYTRKSAAIKAARRHHPEVTE